MSIKVHPDLRARALRRLDALDQADSLADLHLPGMQFQIYPVCGFECSKLMICGTRNSGSQTS